MTLEPREPKPRKLYRIEIKQSAKKAIAKIPLAHRKRISKQIDSLAANPRPPGMEKLAGNEPLYRIRVGDYRIVYQIHDNILLVLVVRVGGRGDVYRHLP